MLNPTGSHALIATSSDGHTYVAVVDIFTGKATGTTVSLIGSLVGSPVSNSDGSHALITTSNGYNTWMRVVNTSTGAGNTLLVDGTLVGSPVFSPNGSHAFVASYDSFRNLTWVRLIDTEPARGRTRIGPGGNPRGLTGVQPRRQPHRCQLRRRRHRRECDRRRVCLRRPQRRPDRRSVAVRTTGGLAGFQPRQQPRLLIISSATTTNTFVTVVDTSAERPDQIGSTVTLPGDPTGSAVFSPDSSRALVTTAFGGATWVAVVNASTGEQTGSTVTLAGNPAAPPTFIPNSNRAVITSSNATTTHVAVINTSTGTQTRSVILAGNLGALRC